MTYKVDGTRPVPSNPNDTSHDETSGVGDLAIADEYIDKVITGTQSELNSFTPKNFETIAFIGDLSFGGSDRAPNLSKHHRWAQRVMAETLFGVEADLTNFIGGCQDARRFLTDADGDVAAQLTRCRQAVEALAEGSGSHHGDDAYDASGGVPVAPPGTGADGFGL